MNKHIRVAIDSMKLEIKAINIDANLYEQFHLDSPYNKKASERRTKLNEAIQYLIAFDVHT